MKSPHNSHFLIATIALLIANPLSLWAGTDDEELLRIEKARERRWSWGYSTNPPALMQLNIYSDAKNDADIDFITTCPNLKELTITIDEKDLGKLARLTRLEELDLYESSIQGDGLTQLAGLTNLHKLNIEKCTLSEKAYESLGSLDHITTLKVNLRDLLNVRNINSLSGIQSLREISSFDFELWRLKKAERKQLVKDLARIKIEIVGHHGEHLDVENAEPPPDYQERIPRYTSVQIDVLNLAWRLTPWLGLFFLAVMGISLYVWRSRRGWVIRAGAHLPWFALFGYVTTLGLTLSVLVIIIPRKPYQEQTTAVVFWDMISHGLRETNMITKLPPLVIGNRHCFYPICSDRSHPWRGTTLCAVSNQEIIDQFPLFFEEALRQKRLSDLHLASLIDQSLSRSNRTEAIQQLREKGCQFQIQPQAIHHFLTTLEWERLSSYKAQSGVQAFAERLELEKEAAQWEDRTRRYWVTVAFEMIYFFLLLSLFWTPLLSSRLSRFAYRFWAMTPMFLVAPFQLGYCWLANSPFGAIGQGLLYPIILERCQPLFFWPFPRVGWLEIPVVGAVERLNQPVLFPGLWLEFQTCAIGAVLISLAAWFIGRWLSKKAFPVKRTEEVISAEHEEHVTPQETSPATTTQARL